MCGMFDITSGFAHIRVPQLIDYHTGMIRREFGQFGIGDGQVCVGVLVWAGVHNLYVYIRMPDMLLHVLCTGAVNECAMCTCTHVQIYVYMCGM